MASTASCQGRPLLERHRSEPSPAVAFEQAPVRRSRAMSHHPHILAPPAGARHKLGSNQGSKQVKAPSVSSEPVSFISIAERFVARNAIGSSINA